MKISGEFYLSFILFLLCEWWRLDVAGCVGNWFFKKWGNKKSYQQVSI